MTDSLTACLVVPAAALVACGGLILRRNGLTRRLVASLAGVQALAAAAFAVLWQVGGGEPLHWTAQQASGPAWLPLSLYYDGYTALMLLMVSFVGWVICRYSVRYLDGQQDQQRYFRWVGFTLGAVSLMVLAGNLLLFFACWVLTSFGLHHLLTYYADRPAARRAAWTKFCISRIGDVAILGAIVLTYLQFRTFEFPELYAAIGAGLEDGSLPNASVAWAGWLLMLGAITKSAQVPFHSWLPLTMETPTPVSALMHAGVVNAGGYLMIRGGLLVSLAPGALLTLAILGTTTACFASLIMLTENSVKRSLAYSTIAQMGFMMLQCGLAAYPAAMLHILAHSLYKAHAFLSSGGVLAQRGATSGVRRKDSRTALVWVGPAAAFIAALAFIGADVRRTKPGRQTRRRGAAVGARGGHGELGDADGELGRPVGVAQGHWVLGTLVDRVRRGLPVGGLARERFARVRRRRADAMADCDVHSLRFRRTGGLADASSSRAASGLAFRFLRSRQQRILLRRLVAPLVRPQGPSTDRQLIPEADNSPRIIQERRSMSHTDMLESVQGAVHHASSKSNVRPQASQPLPGVQLVEVISRVQEIVAPVWPLQDYVAINPFAGLADRPLPEARRRLRAYSDCEMLMPLSYYAEQFQNGRLSVEDIAAAAGELQGEGDSTASGDAVDEIAMRLLTMARGDCRASFGGEATPSEQRVRTLAEVLDLHQGTVWTETLREQIGKFCSAHYDQGQAAWASPWRNLPLFQAWRSAAVHDRTLEVLGLPGFRGFVADLPETPQAAIQHCLQRLGVPAAATEAFLLSQAFAVIGWSAGPSIRRPWPRPARKSPWTSSAFWRCAWRTTLL